MEYLILKWIHIVSSTILFGTGIGLAFFFFAAHRLRDIEGIKFASRMVVLGDWVFTTPAGVIQVISGALLINLLELPLDEPWLLLALFMFAFAGLCWLPVVWLQIKMRNLAANVADQGDLPAIYWRLERLWIVLGALANPTNDANDIAKRLDGFDFDVVKGIDLTAQGNCQIHLLAFRISQRLSRIATNAKLTFCFVATAPLFTS